MPVPIAALHRDPASRAQTLFVRFPEGWQRPVAGFYEAAEELIVVSGVLHMSEVTYGPGDWGYVPAGSVRTSTSAETECVVFARFDGPARWREAAEASGPPPMMAPLRAGNASSAVPSPLGGGTAWLLRAGERDAAWFADPPAPGAAAPVDVELFDPATAAYAFVAAGDPMPDVAGQCFVRTLGGGS